MVDPTPPNAPRETPTVPSPERFHAAYDGTNNIWGGQAPWDIDRAQPAFLELATAGGLQGDVLDVGCGTGEHALLAARLGHDAWGLDMVPAAIARARAKAAERGLRATFVVGDALRLETLGRRFDTVLDSGLFHVFDDADRALYLASLSRVLRPGGLYHVMCFSDLQPGAMGPRRVSQGELRSAFGAGTGWRLASITEARFAIRMSDEGARAWLATAMYVGAGAG